MQNKNNKPLDLNEVSCFVFNEYDTSLSVLADGLSYVFTGDKAKEIHKFLLSMKSLNEQKSGKQILKG
jgi:hypothetical protein